MKKRILVVEDEEKLRRVIEMQLVSGGFDVDKAATAEEALKVVDRADLVLTDLRLPSMDGLAFLGVIRRQNAHVLARIGPSIPKPFHPSVRFGARGEEPADTLNLHRPREFLRRSADRLDD